MIKTIIVDDDIEMLDWMKNVISWENLGFATIGFAKNGDEAFDMCNEFQPDLLITDITMPSMDGLSLIKQVKQSIQNIKTIILTCHEDFQFAKEAIALNANNYLVKYTLTEDDLIKALLEIKHMIETEKKTQVTIKKIYREFTANRTLLEKNFFLSILSDNSNSDLYEQASRLNIQLPKGLFRLISVYIDNYNIEIKKCFIQDEKLLEFALINIAEEVMLPINRTKCFAYDKDRIVFLYWNENDNLIIKPSLINKLTLLQKNVHKILNINLSTCISEVYDDLNYINKAINENEVLRNEYFYRGSDVIWIPKTSFSYDGYQEYLREHERNIMVALELYDKEALIKYMYKLRDFIASKAIHPNIVIKFYKKMLFNIEIIASKQNFSIEVISIEADTFEVLQSQFEQMINLYFEKSLHIKQVPIRKEIKSVCNYIEKNLHENITCKNMSDMVSMNNNYFSRLFKAETGMSFSDYLTNKRIEKATILLTNTDKTIEDITIAVGLKQLSYFYMLYKKVTGKTPGEIRRKD